eukprot:366399-Chlamydomonas_euryale.AAC.57
MCVGAHSQQPNRSLALWSSCCSLALAGQAGLATCNRRATWPGEGVIMAARAFDVLVLPQ